MTREELLKIAKPILFNTEMVQAILEGRKTVTRRVLAEKEVLDKKWGLDEEPYKHNGKWYFERQTAVDDSRRHELKSRYQAGDTLYVRETWCKVGEDVDSIFFEDSGVMYNGQVLYRADGIDLTDIGKWRPSIHMPKEAARIFLKVTDVRVERLQDITPEQSKNEGVDLNSGTPFPKSTARECHGAKEGLSMYQSKFVILWDSTIKKQDLDKYSWEVNPWVWVIEFERVEVKNDREGFNENKNKIL